MMMPTSVFVKDRDFVVVDTVKLLNILRFAPCNDQKTGVHRGHVFVLQVNHKEVESVRFTCLL